MGFEMVVEMDCDGPDDELASRWLDGKTAARSWLLWRRRALLPISRWKIP